jgi:protein-disulfide isomerase
MTVLSRLFLLAAPFAMVAPAAAQAPAQTDWNRVVTQAPNGAFVLGNPRAQTRVIEYFSYTCSHCAHFMVEGMGPLRTGWIRRGLVSVEFRNAVRDPYDMTAALLARCGGKARFVSNHEALFNNFQAWMPRLVAYDEARDKTAPTDQVAAMRDIAVKTGLSDLLAKRGLAPAAQNACLADKAQAQALLGMTQEAWETRKISGTPFFLVNGKAPEANSDWQGLKAALPALPAGGK